MSYPTGVETVTHAYGRSIRPDGTELATTLTITPIFTGTKTATWATTGTSLIPVTLTERRGGRHGDD